VTEQNEKVQTENLKLYVQQPRDLVYEERLFKYSQGKTI